MPEPTRLDVVPIRVHWPPKQVAKAMGMAILRSFMLGLAFTTPAARVKPRTTTANNEMLP